MENIQEISLDINDKGSFYYLYLKQYDIGRTFYFNITENGEPYSLDGIIARISIKKPDNKVILHDCTITDNQIIYDTDEQLSVEYGTAIAQIGLYKDNKLFNTVNCRIKIGESAVKDDDVVSSDDFSALTNALLRVDEIETEIADIVETGNEAIDEITTNNTNMVAAEEIRVSNENTRKSNETIRQSSEIVRSSNETNRNESEGIRIENETDRVEKESARVISETDRNNAEIARNNAEIERNESETERIDNEADREADETTRTANEVTRQAQETTRCNEELLRNSSETERTTNETIRNTNELTRETKETERNTNENTRKENEVTRQNNENTRTSAEEHRVNQETDRNNAEIIRLSNETDRINAEQVRNVSEESRELEELDRADNETIRQSAENTRNINETARNNNEEARILAETNRVSEFNDKLIDINTKLEKSENVNISTLSSTDSYVIQTTNRNGTTTSSPNLLNKLTMGTVETGDYDEEATANITGNFGNQTLNLRLPVGKPFKISKTYASVALLEAHISTDIGLYEFAMVNTGNVEDEDTGKLYMNDVTGAAYLCDLSGSQGIQGVKGDIGLTPNLTVGTVTTTAEGTEATATITGTAENPIINFTIPKGDTGSVASIYGGNIPYSSTSDTQTVKDIVDEKLGKTENATSATKAVKDQNDNIIDETYIKGLSVSGKVITYTKGDNTTGTITTQDTNTTYVDASQTDSGLMSPTDKIKLDNIESGANKTVIDSTLSSTSTNPIQNKVINAALSDKLGTSADGSNVTSTFTETETLSNLTTGEKISISFGKIKKVISDFIAHIGNVSNPHNVTKSDVGLSNVSDELQYSESNPQTNITGNAGTATALTSNAGSSVQPIYFSNGKPVATTYSLGKSVPSNAVFTDTVYTLPTASSVLGGVKTTSSVTSTSDLTACPIISGVPYYKNTTYSLSSFGITASATEINYTDGVTSNIQTQLNNKSTIGHTHSKSEITNFPTSMPASDVYSWAKASSKPSYSWGEISDKPTSFNPSSHNHDDRYYTETEINSKLSKLSNVIKTENNSTYSGVQEVLYIKDSTTAILVTTAGSYAFSVSSWSDLRLKNNIKDTGVSGLDIINSINHKEYDFVDTKYGKHANIGYIAQELAEVIPESIVTVPQPKGDKYSELYQIDKTMIIPYLTKAIQELSQEVDILKKIIIRRDNIE